MKTHIKHEMVPLSKIKRLKGIFPEGKYPGIDTLTEDIRKRGLIVPILVTHNYTIIDGQQRYDAYKKLGLKEIETQRMPK